MPQHALCGRLPELLAPLLASRLDAASCASVALPPSTSALSSFGMPTVSTTLPSASCSRNLRVPSAAATVWCVMLRQAREGQQSGVAGDVASM